MRGLSCPAAGVVKGAAFILKGGGSVLVVETVVFPARLFSN